MENHEFIFIRTLRLQQIKNVFAIVFLLEKLEKKIIQNQGFHLANILNRLLIFECRFQARNLFQWHYRTFYCIFF